ncbi:arginase family protein [Maribellus mangrovi]|uniref:arginase family protein n=1 Tax=Maribellus mangrovi TaxID=3133146 RepID=UPI0030EDADB3
MDLTEYFDAVDFSQLNEDTRLSPTLSFGTAIEKYTLACSGANMGNADVAIVGVPFESKNNEVEKSTVPDSIRKELYQLTVIDKIKVIDLGNLKQAQSIKGNFYALRDITDYLTELDITVLVLGGSEDFASGICQAFRGNQFFTFTAIDAFLDLRKGKEAYDTHNYLSRVFSKQPDIFQFSLIGYQRHYVPVKLFDKTKGVGEHLSLGRLRDSIVLAEPVFRNSDFVTVDFGTLKYSEAKGKQNLPNGLGGEEICQLSKYAGLSRRLKAFALFEVIDEMSAEGLNVSLAAQSAWYFIEGVLQRSHANPENEEDFVVHKVEIWQVEPPLVFYQDNATGQWWLRLQTKGNSFVFLACSEQDFLEATHNEIPEIYLKYVQKIDEILK